MSGIRHPAVAGAFYPADARQLRQMIQGFLEKADVSEYIPKAIIAPHAGYIYSGSIAASVYKRLQKAHSTIQRVVIIGPSHRVGFSGLAVSSADIFSTPLGDIPVDRAAFDTIVGLPFVHVLDNAHRMEHSLEVQLPFLQEIIDHFELVPIVAGNASPEEVADVLDRLWGGRETLIVISSDLSHYHDYETARSMDKATSLAIESLQLEEIDYESACGRIAINGLLYAVRKQKLHVKTVDLRNSGDTAGPHDRVVGYGAYVFE